MARDPHVGRVLMVSPPDDWAHGATDWLDALQPAGVILFRRHLPDDIEATRAAIARLRAWAALHGDTLLIAMDEEGGFVSQISHLVPTPPSARALARATDPDSVRDTFARYGRRMRDLGVNLDFAPVCDVSSNPRNPVIGVRSFGNDAELVSMYARAVHEGLASVGVLSCLKHFPGHGDTDVDSHLARPVIAHERARLDAVELVPFRDLVHAAPTVMVAHVECPGLDGAAGRGTPATLSSRILNGLLRGELGFEGVIVSDALEMQGLSNEFGPGDAAALALGAGCDLLLRCDSVENAMASARGIEAALASGKLTQSRLAAAAARVDRLRALAAAGSDRPELAAPLADASREQQTYRLICRAAVQWSGESRWAAVATEARGGRALRLAGWNADVLDRFATRLDAHGVQCETCVLGAAAVPEAVDLLVLAERRPLSDAALALAAELADRSPHMLLANLLTPEVDEPIAPRFAARLRSFDHSDLMLDTVVDTWLTRRSP